MTIYIAGRMTGHEDFNLPAFDKAEAMLKGRGYETVSPADLTREFPNLTYHEYIRRGLLRLLTCEHIYMLKGWTSSSGATLEHHVAQKVGMNILYQGDEEEF